MRSRRAVIALGQFRDHAGRTIAQLRARRVQIDHQIALHFSERDHRAGADDIERNLGRRSGPQPCRAGQNLRTDREINCQVEMDVRFARGIAAQQNRFRA